MIGKIEEVPLKEILLNTSNPRFDPVNGQVEAINKMLDVQKTEIKNLAKDIAKNGLNPSNIIIVYKYSNNKFITLEGNRRVVCLLLLSDPTKTSNRKMESFFSSLKKNYPNIQTTVPCLVAKNKDDMFHWIKLIHTGKNQGVGVSQWKPEQKTRFLQSQPTTARFHKAFQIFNYAGKKSIKKDDVDLSNLDRLIATPQVRKVLGISFSEGKLIIDNELTFDANIKKVFQQMSKESFTVRDIDKRETRVKWIHDIVDSAGKSSKSFPASTPTKKTPTSQKSTSRNRLIPLECNLNIEQPKIRNVFLELKDDLYLDNTTRSTPNAVGVLFRVFLEISIDYYLQNVVKIDTKGLWLPTKIKKVASYMMSNGIASKSQLSVIRRTGGKQTDVLHILRFHELVHSTTISPESLDLKQKWDNLQEFMVILWNDADKNT